MVDRYFKRLLEIVKADEQESGTYLWLLEKLYETPFRWVLELDANRALDGLALRDNLMGGCSDDSECSVLEMLVALAVRCEQDIMQDDDYGDRTSVWFWLMIENLGLKSMNDQNYNEAHVEQIIDNFLDRNYDRYGNGSIFWSTHPRADLRKVEIWYQMCWYLVEHIDCTI